MRLAIGIGYLGLCAICGTLGGDLFREGHPEGILLAFGPSAGYFAGWWLGRQRI